MGLGENKLFQPLLGRPLLIHTLEKFEACPVIGEIIVMVGRGEVARWRREIRAAGCHKVSRVVVGGVERQDSVRLGLRALQGPVEIVVVHDGARPFVEEALIEAVVREARVFGAAIAALPVRDTVKLAGVDGAVEATLAREGVWLAQTPQAFDARLLRQAHRQALRAGVLGTDDAALVERLGVKVRLVRGSEANFKVTTPEDLTLSQALVGAQEVRR